MSASVIMLLAVVLYIIHRWATGKPAVTLATVLGGIFAIFIIALLDRGKSEPVAKGFAFLFLLVAAYNAIPAFTNAINSANKTLGPSPVQGL